GVRRRRGLGRSAQAHRRRARGGPRERVRVHQRPAARASARLGPSLTVRSPMAHRIDVHHHIAPPSYLAALHMRKLGAPPTMAWTLAKSLEDMDRAEVATAITSLTTPAIGPWVGDAAAARGLARECNEYAAKLMTDHPGRFGMFAVLPMPDVDA